jgi:hypothetical protein
MEDEFDNRPPADDVDPSSPGEDEEEVAARERAERLRQEIERLREGEEPSSPEPESPRDFVERRRRELDDEEGSEPDA